MANKLESLQEVTPEVRREVEKIPGLIDQRKLKWDKIWLEQHKNLEQHSSLARFEEELRLVRKFNFYRKSIENQN